MSLDETLQGILRQGFSGTQAELKEELKRQGHDVNQSTVSRAIKRLRAQKKDGGWTIVEESKSSQRAYQSVHEHIVSLRRNEVMIFIKTIPGSAQYVASYFDQMESPLVLGTVAGDDSLMVMPASVERIRQCFDHVRKMLSGAE